MLDIFSSVTLLLNYFLFESDHIPTIATKKPQKLRKVIIFISFMVFVSPFLQNANLTILIDYLAYATFFDILYP